jgi:ATP-dependent helicase/nuclease subunit A
MMPSLKWTEQQLEAISRKNCNLLVAAGAGSGKTAVLVERIIRRITDDEDPVNIDELLVVTFTKAAASEMKERIGDALSKALENSQQSSRVHRQLMYLNKASITTIHSFCLDVIKNYFHIIDLDPDFRVADETEANLIKLEALEELFEEKYEGEDSNSCFFSLIQCYGGGRDDYKLRQMVLNFYNFIQSYPWPLKWLKESAEAFNIINEVDFQKTAWAKTIVEKVQIELSGFVELLDIAIDIIERTEGLEGYLSCYREDFENLKALRNICFESSWDELHHACQNLKFSRLSRCGKNVDKAVQDQVKGLRDEVKKGMKKIIDEDLAFTASQIVQDLREIHPLLSCLADLVAEFQNNYIAKKRQRALLDFNDLEHLCLEILVEHDESGNIQPTEIAMLLRKKYNEILIDEYQDSNLVQEVILTAISREEDNSNLFMVGDVKQSIYRFRQARPELFMEKYLSYSTSSKKQKNHLD